MWCQPWVDRQCCDREAKCGPASNQCEVRGDGSLRLPAEQGKEPDNLLSRGELGTECSAKGDIWNASTDAFPWGRVLMPSDKGCESATTNTHGLMGSDTVCESTTTQRGVAGTNSSTSIVCGVAGTNSSTSIRTRSQSLGTLPESLRGISLGELWKFYDTNRAWLEEYRWWCDKCHKSFQQDYGPCPNCMSDHGRVQMRNLYEVNREMIIPYCAEKRTSYAELLAAQRDHMLPVETFVSHWWGEEFPKFMLALENYAQARCAPPPRFWIPALIYAFVCFIYAAAIPNLFACFGTFWVSDDSLFWHMYAISLCHAGEYGQPRSSANMTANMTVNMTINMTVSMDSQRDCREVTWFLLLIYGFLSIVTLLCIHWRTQKKHRSPLSWVFWVCAFCNNQYAVEHALAVNGDVTQSAFAQAIQCESCNEVVAILDDRAMIYNRIWCVFELFYTKVFMLRRFGRKLTTAISNEMGVVSDGDATRQGMNFVRGIIDKIDCSAAKSTHAEDNEIIRKMMVDAGTTNDDIDRMLRNTVHDGLQAIRVRRLAPLVFSSALPCGCTSACLLCLADTFDLLRLGRDDPVVWVCFGVSVLLTIWSLYGKATPHMQRMRWRVFWVAFGLVAQWIPLFILFEVGFAQCTKTLVLRKKPSHFQAAQAAVPPEVLECVMRVSLPLYLCSLAQILGAAGMSVLGLCYAVFSDFSCCRPVRHRLRPLLA